METPVNQDDLKHEIMNQSLAPNHTLNTLNSGVGTTNYRIQANQYKRRPKTSSYKNQTVNTKSQSIGSSHQYNEVKEPEIVKTFTTYYT